MPSFTDLPAEIRQQILFLNFPDTNYINIPLPKPISTYISTSHLFQQDVITLLRIWSPMQYITDPKHLTNPNLGKFRIANRTISLRMDRVCLDVFHNIPQGRLMVHCGCMERQICTRPGLEILWQRMVPLIPKTVKEIYIDITPAPFEKRDGNGYSLGFLISSFRTQRFLFFHRNGLVQLVECLHTELGEHVPVTLIGTLSGRSSKVLFDWDDNDLPRFTGRWISRHQASLAKIDQGVSSILVSAGDDRWTLHSLRNVQWSDKTRWAYAKVVDGGERHLALADMKSLIECTMDRFQKPLTLISSGYWRRELQRLMALDMQLIWQMQEDGRHASVTFSRLPCI